MSATGALFATAMEHVDYDKLAKKEVKPLSPEDIAWLKEALAESGLGKTETEVMIESLKVIRSESSTDDDLLNALDDIQFHCEQFDTASDLVKVGGLDDMLRLVQAHSSQEVRVGAAWVIASASSHNDYVREAIITRNGMETLLFGLNESSYVPFRQKCLYALSSLVRDHPMSQSKFMSLNGFSVVLNAYLPSSPPLAPTSSSSDADDAQQRSLLQFREKAAFLLLYLLHHCTSMILPESHVTSLIMGALVAIREDSDGMILKSTTILAEFSIQLLVALLTKSLVSFGGEKFHVYGIVEEWERRRLPSVDSEEYSAWSAIANDIQTFKQYCE